MELAFSCSRNRLSSIAPTVLLRRAVAAVIADEARAFTTCHAAFSARAGRVLGEGGDSNGQRQQQHQALHGLLLVVVFGSAAGLAASLRHGRFGRVVSLMLVGAAASNGQGCDDSDDLHCASSVLCSVQPPLRPDCSRVGLFRIAALYLSTTGANISALRSGEVHRR